MHAFSRTLGSDRLLIGIGLCREITIERIKRQTEEKNVLPFQMFELRFGVSFC